MTPEPSVQLEELLEPLRALLAALEAGELTAGPLAIGYLRGALEVVEGLVGEETTPGATYS